VKYNFGFMFFYSERPGTYAARNLEDNIPLAVKKRRLNEIIAKQQAHSLYRNQRHIGQIEEVLVEGTSKKSDQQLFGRNTQNTVVVFDKEDYKPGDFVRVKIERCTAATLLGTAVEKVEKA
jgi:tRNA-2-methylthio-N6-dimethylallyladenosine synthase